MFDAVSETKILYLIKEANFRPKDVFNSQLPCFSRNCDNIQLVGPTRNRVAAS